VTTLTYGEQLLADAEDRVHRRSARRRTIRLLLPFVAASLWALADLAAARGARLTIGGAGSFRVFFDHLMVGAWGLAFVIAPMVAALKREPLPSGAALSVVAGPLAMPFLFGAGGWKWWQTIVVILIGGLVVASSRTRRSART
jgi:hypothetical protein